MFGQGLLSDEVKITKVSDVAASGTDAVEGTAVDMAGYDGVLFLSSIGTAAANNSMHAEQSSDAAVADAYADIAGSEVDVATSDEDLFIDILRPRERYVRPVVLRGTATTVENIWAIQYRCKDGLPVDNETAGTIAGKKLVYPAEGTK